MTHRTKLYGTAAVLVFAGLIGAACGSSGGDGTAATTPRSGSLPGALQARSAPGEPIAAPSADRDAARALASTVPAVQQRVVKTATLDLTVGRGSFDQRFQQTTQIAAQNGGYVASSDTAGRRLKSGTVVLRVPADQFETALGELKALGRESAVHVSGQDVTAQFVDLNARLRNWQAQEAVLLGLMKRAASITDSIRVRPELQDLELNIQGMTGELRVLNDQADLSTITVAMAEVGAAPRPKTESTLEEAWGHATHGFVAVIAAVVVGLGYLAPFAVIGILLALALGFARRQRSRVTPAEPAA